MVYEAPEGFYLHYWFCPSLFEYQDYLFDGWTITGDNSGVSYYSQEYGYPDDDKHACISDIFVKGDMTFEAKWVKACEITFESDEGYIDGDSEKTSTSIKAIPGVKLRHGIPDCYDNPVHILTGLS